MTRTQAEADQLPDSSGPDRIVRVTGELREEALRTVIGDGRSSRSQVDRFLAFSHQRGIDLDAMWARLDRSGRVLGAALAVPNPGRTAMLFGTPPSDAAQVAAQGRLIDHVCEALRTTEVDLAQALAEPGHRRHHEAFLAGGLHDLAMLGYMERPIPRPGEIPPPRWPEGVSTAPFREGDEPALIDVLDASYEDTRDCPGLRGLRRTEDILAGHRATGAFEPALWTLLLDGGVPAGALLLNPAPASRTIELVYIGLALRGRGRGLGAALLRHGLRLAARRADTAVTLAVDEANAPALRLYRGAGFRRVARRRAMIRSVQPIAPGPDR
jgi:ribosomal protein S18 acetylase RimI-like enzyme